MGVDICCSKMQKELFMALHHATQGQFHLILLVTLNMLKYWIAVFTRCHKGAMWNYCMWNGLVLPGIFDNIKYSRDSLFSLCDFSVYLPTWNYHFIVYVTGNIHLIWSTTASKHRVLCEHGSFNGRPVEHSLQIIMNCYSKPWEHSSGKAAMYTEMWG